MKKAILLLALLLLTLVPAALADPQTAPLETELSAEDRQTFDQILEPVIRIYNFIKYIASIIGVIILVFAGITYMTSGSNPGKRETAKNMAAYVVVGLIIIWAAPLIVGLFV